MDLGQSQRVALELIDPPIDPHRRVIDPQALGELADDMAAQGLLQPIGLCGPSEAGRYRVAWGHRRYLAALMLHWGVLDAKVFPWGFDPLDAMVTENHQRADLTPLEEAVNVTRMQARGDTIAAIARTMRRSEHWVTQRLDLLSFPEDIQAAVQARQIPLTVARELARIDHGPYRIALIEDARKHGATGAVAASWVQHFLSDEARNTGNLLMVDEIMSRRDAWVIYTPCESCQTKVDYRETRSFRFCARCSADVDAAIRGSAPGAATQAELPDGPPNTRS